MTAFISLPDGLKTVITGSQVKKSTWGNFDGIVAYLDPRPDHEHGAVVDIVLDRLVDGTVEGHQKAGHGGQDHSEPFPDVKLVELVKFFVGPI